MQYIKIICSVFAFAVCMFLVVNGVAHAVATPPLFVISEIETTGSDGAGADVPFEEFVKLSNTTGDALEINNWQLDYLSASGGTVTPLATLNGIVHPYGNVLVAHANYPGAVPDKSFGAGSTSVLAKSGGQVRLTNGSGTVIDMVGWGGATVAAPWPKIAQINSGYSTKRIIPGHPLFGMGIDYTFTAGTRPMTPEGGAFVPDACPNLDDIQTTVPVTMMIEGGNCVPIPPPDVCNNIVGDQATIPDGYAANGDGGCEQDACRNIDGLQLNVPEHYDQDVEQNCVQHDECDNIPDIQPAIPENMIRKNSNDCGLDLVPLQLTEILPNASGSDTDHEYIEIYNPSNVAVDLASYSLRIGPTVDKVYAFPTGAKIGPGEYETFYNNNIKFTLANTTSRVVLATVDGTVLGDTGIYDSPGDNMAWAFIDGMWQFTNQPTPGVANLASFVDDATDVSSTAGATLCPEGKYRNPLTNRCRNIATDAAVLAVCDADQYRNPDTGRCRKIAASATGTPCKEGQYRSEETNRCRNIATASATLAPCKEGQERNPDTNRCKNTAAKSVPDAAFAVEPMKQGAKAFVGWWALGGIGTLALGYAGWEWRQEVKNSLQKIKGFSPRK